MEEGLRQLWEDIHFSQSEYQRKIDKVRFLLTTDSQYADEVISLTSECREIAHKLHAFGLQVLALGGNLSIKNQVTEQTTVPEATREDIEKLYFDRLSGLDSFTKLAFELRKSKRKYEVPWGGVKAHEKPPKRHLITKHVNQTLTDLKKQRQKGKPNTPFFSSFPTQEMADQAALEVLANNYNLIQEWLKVSKNTDSEGFNYECNFQVGYGIKKQSDKIFYTNKTRLVLIKDDKSLSGYRIKTGHPIL